MTITISKPKLHTFLNFLKLARDIIRPAIPFPKRKTLKRYFPSFETRNIAYIFNLHNIDTIMDVGANIGQFGVKMRSAGYHGRIVSFEPIGAVHAELTCTARRYRGWDVVPPMALGDRNGEAVINVMADHSMSSILTPRYDQPVRNEHVPVRTLDEAVGGTGVPDDAVIALKIDVQGYEPQVLAGAEKTLSRARAILIELGFRAVYEGEANYIDLLRFLQDRGFHAVYFSPVINRKRLGEAFQMDALLVKRN